MPLNARSLPRHGLGLIRPRFPPLRRPDGVGLPSGFDLDTSVNLGLSIVRTLVESELGGLLELRPRAGRGARAVVDVPLE